MRNPLLNVLVEEEGAVALEYGLLTALVALVMAGGAVALGVGLKNMFSDVGGAVDGVEITDIGN